MKKEKSTVKKVLLNSGFYTVTSILQKGIGFLLLPLYTLYLTPTDYGITGIVNSFTAILTLLFTLSLNGSVQRYYYVYQADKEKLRSFYGTIVMFVIFNSLILSAIIIVFQRWLISPFIEGIEFYPYIFLGVLTVLFNPMYTIYQSLLQTLQKGKEFSINSLLHFALMVFLNVLFIVVFQLGAVGQLLSYLVTAVVFGLYSLISLYRKKVISFNFNFSYLREALSYSVPLIPHNLSSTIAAFISRLLLNNLISTASAGLFNIASQFMLIIDTFHMSVNNAYIPWFYGEMEKGTKKSHEGIIKFADIISKGYLVISVAVSFFIKEIIQIFLPSSYLNAWMIIPIMLVAYQLRSIYLFYVNTLFYNTKSTRFIFIASVTGSLVNIITMSSLTSVLGIFAPAVALLAQQMVVVIIVIILSRRLEPVDFKLNNMILYIIIMILAMLIGQFYDFSNPTSEISIINILYKAVILIIVTFLILYRDLPIIKEQVKLSVGKFKKKG